MLEDESGRLRMTGRCLEDALLVTGAIIAAIGTENSDGVFEVLEIKLADLPRQPERWELEDSEGAVAGKSEGRKHGNSTKIALISGLQISGNHSDALQLDLLAQTLTGELGGPELQAKVASISRLIIAGDSLANACPIPSREEFVAMKKSSGKKYGYDSSSYNAAPTVHLDDFLESILPTISVILLPGETDPANVQIPQQAMHPALFPKARLYAKSPLQKVAAPSTFDPVTNPWEGEVEGWRFLGNGGQPVSDVFKYLESDDRLEMMESMLRWRCNAPTAPDTLCKLLSAQTLLLLGWKTDVSGIQGATLSRTMTRSSSTTARTSTSRVTSHRSALESSRGRQASGLRSLLYQSSKRRGRWC